MLPRIWEGGTAFILGGGPSLSLVNFDLIKERKIIAVNNAYGYPVIGRGRKSGDGWLENTEKYIPYDWVDIVWFGDGVWFNRHHLFLKQFSGIIAHCAPMVEKKKIPGLLYYQRCTEKARGIINNPKEIAWNKSSGASAINLAVHLGVKRIVLLGFDMKRTETQTNWHFDHPNPPEKNPYYRFLRSFPFIKKDLDKLEIEVINCSINSAIQEFKIMKLEDFLKWEKKQKRKKK